MNEKKIRPLFFDSIGRQEIMTPPTVMECALIKIEAYLQWLSRTNDHETGGNNY
jgi:hypothetical protein